LVSGPIPSPAIMKTYTFHITVDDLPNSWRRVELAEQQTLRDLHTAIQEAFEWDPDDDIAFIVGDKPLEGGEIYDLSFDDDWDYDDVDDWDDEDEDDDGDDDEGEDDEELDALIDGPSPQVLGELSPSERMEGALTMLENDPEVRALVRQMLIDQMGVPAFMADMMLNSMRSMLEMLPEEQLRALLADETPAKNAAAATLESLGLGLDKELLYVYGEDEWRFVVRVEAINDSAEDDALYPLVLDGDGPAPEQYFDDDEDEDEEDDLMARLWEEESDFEDED
jgi:hypothetical protein